MSASSLHRESTDSLIILSALVVIEFISRVSVHLSISLSLLQEWLFFCYTRDFNMLLHDIIFIHTKLIFH